MYFCSIWKLSRTAKQQKFFHFFRGALNLSLNLIFSKNLDILLWDDPVITSMNVYIKVTLRKTKMLINIWFNAKVKTLCCSIWKNKPNKFGSKMKGRCLSKVGYLFILHIYTDSKETGKFGIGNSFVLQLNEKLKGSFCCMFFLNLSTSRSLLRRFTDNSFYGIRVVYQNQNFYMKSESQIPKLRPERSWKVLKISITKIVIFLWVNMKLLHHVGKAQK